MKKKKASLNEIKIRAFNRSDLKNAKSFQRFVNALVDEDVPILTNKKFSLKEQKQVLKERLEGIKKKQDLYLIAFDGKKVVGVCGAHKREYRADENVSLGLGVLEAYRGIGLGRVLLADLITLTQKKFKPRKIYVVVFSGNAAAVKLYHKLGFREVARLPAWIKYKGKYVDCIYLELK